MVWQKFSIFFRKVSSISFTETLNVARSEKAILRWNDDKYNAKNFGDALNPVLFSKATGDAVVSSKKVLNIFNKPVFCFTGSILDNIKNNNIVICGAGFQKESSSLKCTPHAILAIRGPLSRNILLNQGLNCPENYCDPALLLPLFFPRLRKSKKYDVGIIAHYVDKNILNKINIEQESLTYKIIDIEESIESVIDEICNVSCIFSSSLHGIIVAHAYGIPAVWMKLSEKIIGGDFKYRDYYLSLGEDTIPTYQIEKDINLKKGTSLSTLYNTRTNSHGLIMSFESYLGKKLEIKVE